MYARSANMSIHVRGVHYRTKPNFTAKFNRKTKNRLRTEKIGFYCCYMNVMQEDFFALDESMFNFGNYCLEITKMDPCKCLNDMLHLSTVVG